MRPWILSEVNYGYVKEHTYEVAVLPMGATEPHNLHLPYGTDMFEATEMASRSCEAAFKKGAKVIMLPTIPYGTETNMLEFPLTMNLNPSTLTLVISDLVASLAKHNIQKLVILNSHGGNDFKPVLRELQCRFPVKLFLCDWFRGMTADVRPKIFHQPGDHADEVETSLGLAFFPDLVARDPKTGALLADDGTMAPSRFDAVNRGWIALSRAWHLLTTNTGAGNPHAATAEKGRQIMEVIVERLSGFLVELSTAKLDGQFPF